LIFEAGPDCQSSFTSSVALKDQRVDLEVKLCYLLCGSGGEDVVSYHIPHVGYAICYGERDNRILLVNCGVSEFMNDWIGGWDL